MPSAMPVLHRENAYDVYNAQTNRIQSFDIASLEENLSKHRGYCSILIKKTIIEIDFVVITGIPESCEKGQNFEHSDNAMTKVLQ